MTIATIDNRSRTNGLPLATDELRIGNEGSTLVYRIESRLRNVAPTAVGRDGALVVEETDARVLAGRLSGGRLRGLERVLVQADGSAVIEGCEGIDIGDEHVAVDLRGSVHPARWSRLPSPDSMVAPGYDFPDEDLRITGTALFRTSAPSYAHLDGAIGQDRGLAQLHIRRAGDRGPIGTRCDRLTVEASIIGSVVHPAPAIPAYTDQATRAGSSAAEQGTFNPRVLGSNPSRLTRIPRYSMLVCGCYSGACGL